jgi:hypothetical protein
MFIDLKTGYRFFSLLWIARMKEAAPSPYIEERVAYRTRNPNGIFD